LKAAIAEAFAIDGAAIVDAVVVSNELPNLPHLDLEMVEHFALAKKGSSSRRNRSMRVASYAGDKRERTERALYQRH
jgi:hypothetical protein